ncbi:hypothetical protein [Sorangium sp. So ce426]|uniref:hypothetical protein n=1 Tax=Sorangium sp. So ce426 TaxID=3133312 RepID=UPI003F5BC380
MSISLAATAGCQMVTMPDRSLINEDTGGSGGQGGTGGGGSGGNDGGGGSSDGGGGSSDGGGGSGGGDGGSGGGDGGSGGGDGGSGGGDGGSGGGDGGSGGGNGGSDGGAGGVDGNGGNGGDAGAGGGAGGGGGDGGAGGIDGSGGGGDVPCTGDTDCPAPDSECATARCVDGGCTTEPVASGTPVKDQMAGDCRERVCDGEGAVTEVADDDDVRDDHSQCTVDSCRDGSPINDPVEAGTWCSLADGGLCNPAGVCVECLVDWDCPTELCVDYVCQVASCEDGLHNGNEGGIDCGGSACPACGAPARVTSVDYPVIAVGGALVLTGSGFTGATEVTVDFVPQPFTIDSDTQITIPALSGSTPIGPADIVVNRPGARWTSFPVTVIRLQINEVDADTPDSGDLLEFIEISTGWRYASLAGYTLVLYDGATDGSYHAIELDGTADVGGLLLVGTSGVEPTPALVFPTNTLQNGPAAVALYQGLPAAFPSSTPATAARLIDALVYGPAAEPDTQLLNALISSAPGRVQVSEGATSALSQAQSIQRCANGLRDGRRFGAAAPTPRRPNTLPCP